MKQSIYKTIGRATLYLDEMEELLLDVEIAVNNRLLSYVEEDVQLPLLTPNLMMYGQSNILPETVVADIEDTELRKRAEHLRRCKNVLWSRWTTEHVRELRERHNLEHNSKKSGNGDNRLIRQSEHFKPGTVVYVNKLLG